MSETTPDPADVHTGTDRVELTDAEYDQLSDALKLEPPTPDAPMYYVGGIDDVVASIMAARLQALTAERDALAARCAELEAKSEAFRGLSESWHRMYEGAEALNADIRQRALALADQWDRDLGKAFNPHGDELRAALTPEGKPQGANDA